jgi:DNA-binding beta-propeller fold protein YncE
MDTETLSVINTDSNIVAATIEVGDVPNSLEVNNGNLYVVCGGKPVYLLQKLLENW